jgi:hypothetical protein
MRDRSLPPGYTLFAWCEAAPADRATAQAYEKSPDFPPGVTPFLEEDRIDLSTSLGLREHGRLVGWLIAHRLGVELVRYTSLFVHPATAVKGLGFRMLLESVRRHLAADGLRENSQAAWDIRADNPLAAFVRRRIAPHLPDLSVTLTMECEKELAFPDKKKEGD